MFEKMSGESKDIVKDHIEKLKQLFPEVVSEGQVDFDQLKDIFTEVDPDEIAQDERYNFTWSGKRRSIHIAQQPSKGTLRPVKEKSKNWDKTQNIYIEGDNLEVLKLLQKSYFQKVKMIYIDPPYNTGNDFVYKDDYKDGIENYLEQTGQVDSDGNKMSTNTESNGRYHSDWLNMMYPRLQLARNLLKDDGVIFISIDDNEQDNLKKMCNEIFGENNFVAQLIWQRAFSPKNDAKFVSNSHDYVLMIAKSINCFQIGRLPRTEEANARYSNPDNDPRGPWMSSDISVKTYNAAADYPITLPSGRVVEPPAGRCWSLSKNAFLERLQDNRIWFGPDGDGTPRIKRFLSELKFDGMAPTSILHYKEVGHSQEGAKEVTALLEAGVFDGPKPVRLLRRLITLANLNKNDIVLDFFSGSATTAHAVIQLNTEDAGHRKFIMVQLPELCNEKSEAYKAGYRTICDIGEERIRRAGEKIKKELIEKREKEGMLPGTMTPDDLDIGFKVFKLDRSNIREWYADFDHIGEQMDLFENNFVKGRSEEDIVYEIMLKSGLDLNYPIEKINFHGKNIYNTAYGALFICLDDQITVDVTDKLVELKNELNPEKTRVVFKDLGFKDDQTKINVYENLKANGFEELLSI